MSTYAGALESARNQGRVARDAMEAWVSRAPDEADATPASVLEGHARDLRASRERLLELLGQHGNRDDIEAALEENEQYHKSLGLSIRDKPET